MKDCINFGPGSSGFCHINYNIIKRCVNLGTIVSTRPAGIVRSSCGTIEECINFGTIKATMNSILPAAGICNSSFIPGVGGGLPPSFEPRRIINCVNYGLIVSYWQGAGICHTSPNPITNCINVGVIVAPHRTGCIVFNGELGPNNY